MISKRSVDTIPTVVNPHAGTADAAIDAVRSDDRFRLVSSSPDTIEETVRSEVARGTPRVAIVGGDGTVATTAAATAGTGTALAIVPAGTLNHFSKHLGLPLEPDRALEVAARGPERAVDVGYVNDRLFLNTSSVGAYLDFVRIRDRWERRTGYHVASVLSAVSILIRLPSYGVSVDVEGRVMRYKTPMVFVGVGERDLRFPSLGERAEGGRSGLHVIVAAGESRRRLLATALVAAVRGAKMASRAPYLDDFLLDGCTVELPGSDATVAADGEAARLASPLRYRLDREALRVVVPAGSAAGR